MNYREINNYISKNNIFNTIELKINISSNNIMLTNPDKTYSNEKFYSIDNIEINNNFLDTNDENINLSNIKEFIRTINNNIRFGGYRKEETDKGWTLFYLFKELISYFQRMGFNYYRGQSSNWETIPSIFRNFKSDEGNMYYEDFEKIYRNIQKKFPDKIKYISLDDLKNYNEISKKILDDRSKEIALLQHYGIKTSLLDITSNPFIAMLFMISGELRNNFQLELYNIKEDNDLFSDVEFSSFNKRITAQKGAFLNYDALVIEDIRDKIFNNKITRIKINVHYSSEITKNNIKDNNKTKNYYAIIEEIDSVEYEKKIILNIQDNLRRKLKEFSYEEFELFPDFEDYLKYTMSLYV